MDGPTSRGYYTESLTIPGASRCPPQIVIRYPAPANDRLITSGFAMLSGSEIDAPIPWEFHRRSRIRGCASTLWHVGVLLKRWPPSSLGAFRDCCSPLRASAVAAFIVGVAQVDDTQASILAVNRRNEVTLASAGTAQCCDVLSLRLQQYKIDIVTRNRCKPCFRHENFAVRVIDGIRVARMRILF